MFGWRNNHSPALRAVTSRQPFLNLGCGDRFHEEWTNVDIAPRDPRVLPHDLRRDLPFPDGAFEAVYHSHVLEHIPREEAARFLSECFRVLRPGGVIRVVVPDLETIVKLYLGSLEGALAGDPVSAERYQWIVLELLDQLVRHRSGGEMMKYWQQEPMPAADFVYTRMGAEVRRWRKGWLEAGADELAPASPRKPTDAELGRFRRSGEVHRWMYDRYSLAQLLVSVGFDDAAVCSATQSAISGFDRFGLDVESDGAVRKPDSLFMEARKPDSTR